VTYVFRSQTIRLVGALLGGLLGAAGLLGCGPTEEPPTSADVAAYFGLVDGVEHTFVDANAFEETHEFRKVSGVGEREVYERIVRRGGFVQDDLTLQLEASLERGLEVVRFHDCVTLCGELSTPIAWMSWPLEGGESLQTDVTVEVSRNGTVEETRQESHQLQIGNEEDVTVPAGTFPAFRVIWTVTGDASRSLQMVIAPDEGLVVSEGFDGSRFERQ